MREDRLIQRIEDDVEEMGESNKLKDKVYHAADKYKYDVLTELNDAKNILKTCGKIYACLVQLVIQYLYCIYG